MTSIPAGNRSFAYQARTPGDQIISGSIEAADEAQAMQSLRELGLGEIKFLGTGGGRPLSRDDFFAFNQQLAQLAGAGLPVEQGLHLLAQEMRRGRLQGVIEQVARDMEKGKTMAQAIEANRKQFPPLYAQIVDAGVRSGNLQAVLLNLGRHLSMVKRIQKLLWQTFTYPVLVLIIFLIALGYVVTAVMPELHADLFTRERWWGQPPSTPPIYFDWMVGLAQALKQWGMVRIVGWIAAGGAAICLLIWIIARNRRVRETMLLSLPMLKKVFRRNLIARWCDAVGIGVKAGMDLPGAIALADDAIGSPRLAIDGAAISNALNEGRPITDVTHGRIIPPLVIVAMDAAARRNDLPEALESLADSYQRQAEASLLTLQTVMAPAVLVILGILVFLLMAATLVPMLQFLS